MENQDPSIKKKAQDRVYLKDFQYKHKTNPYDEKLAVFDDFVMRDNDSESFKGKWNQEVFKNQHPIALEIGTGFGKFMHEYCMKHPEENFVGMDFRFKRSFQLARKLSTIPNKNFRYLRAMGERLDFIFGESELKKIFYFFPDPWPKKRHFKKRLFQEPLLNAAYNTLEPQGEFIIKTDHDGYFDWMVERAQKDERFEIIFKSYDLRTEYPDHFLCGFETEFERIFINQGIKIKAMILKSKKICPTTKS